MITTNTGTSNSSTQTTVKMSTNEFECTKCKDIVPLYRQHKSEECYLTKFRKFDANKQNLISIFNLITQKYHFDYISGNLKNVFPRILSKSIYVAGRGADIFVESWCASAIDSYIKNDGYAGLHLAEFLDKMISQKQSNVKR